MLGGQGRTSHRPSRSRWALWLSTALLLMAALVQGDPVTAGTPSPDQSGPVPSGVLPTPEIVIADRFARTVRHGLGTADVGGRYILGTSRADYSVATSAGRLGLDSGSTLSALLSPVATDSTLRVDVSVDALPTVGSAWVYLVARHTADGQEARVHVRIEPSGHLWIGASSVTAGVETPIGGEQRIDGQPVIAGGWVRLEAQVVGDPATIQARAWPGIQPPPMKWQLDVSDTASAIPASGSFGVRAHLGEEATTGLTVLLDDLQVGLGANPIVTTSQAQSPSASGITLSGAGDIGICGNEDAHKTAAILNSLPGLVFADGDLAYPSGSDTDFAQCFDPAWGDDRWRMLPATGNHEYQTPGAAAYFHYFGAAAGPPGGYYAVDVGGWRVYVLNSECEVVDCTVDSAQLRWLRGDLAVNPRECSMAFWHEPRFGSGPHGDNPNIGPIWDALYAAGTDLVVNGHDHMYERFAPMDPDGSVDVQHGITEIITGTGGAGRAVFGKPHPGSVVRIAGELGVLELTLQGDHVDWHWVPVVPGLAARLGDGRVSWPATDPGAISG